MLLWSSLREKICYTAPGDPAAAAAAPRAPSGRRNLSKGFFWFIRTEQGGGGEIWGFLQLLSTREPLCLGRAVAMSSQARAGQVSALFPGRICLISSTLNAQEEEEAPLLWSTQEREQQSGLSLLQQPGTKPQKEPNDNKNNKKHNTETHCGSYRKKVPEVLENQLLKIFSYLRVRYLGNFFCKKGVFFNISHFLKKVFFKGRLHTSRKKKIFTLKK